MSAINWRRGLFRLWALAACLWVGIVLALILLSGDLQAQWEDFGRAARWERIIARVEKGIADGGMKDNEGNFLTVEQLEADLLGIKERQAEVMERSLKARDWLLGLLAVLLAPTLSLLVVGRAGLWVAEGFRLNRGQ